MKMTKFLKEVHYEMGKVAWPTRKQAMRLTFVVIIVAGVVSVYVAALDYSFSRLINSLIGRK